MGDLEMTLVARIGAEYPNGHLTWEQFTKIVSGVWSADLKPFTINEAEKILDALWLRYRALDEVGKRYRKEAIANLVPPLEPK